MDNKERSRRFVIVKTIMVLMVIAVLISGIVKTSRVFENAKDGTPNANPFSFFCGISFLTVCLIPLLVKLISLIGEILNPKVTVNRIAVPKKQKGWRCR
jgi:hypothetical protein